ncbi:MAG: DUF4301 family protein [Flavobacteriaceae bacterium]
MKFTKKEIKQIETHGLSLKKVSEDIEKFEYGFPHTEIISAAKHDNGIEVFNTFEQEKYIDLYEKKKDQLVIVKFVPASGAATRMFKALHLFVSNYNPEEQKLNKYFKENPSEEVQAFLKGLPHFPFIKILRKKIRTLYPDYKFYRKGKRTHLLVKTLLEEEGLGYSNLPKGLIPFHSYAKNTATAFEEQLLEAGYYAVSKGQCYLHFTFSEEHVEKFKKEFNRIQKRVERKVKCAFNISYSFQNKSTDTIAVTMANKPFKDEDKNLHFRPAGHGALLKNLNEVDADLVFVKNIDNVVTEEAVKNSAQYKKVLTGKLLEIQARCFKYLKEMDNTENPETLLKDVRGFLASSLNCKSLPETLETAKEFINRPIRVCGMVQNTGAPGGGPFWTKDKNGHISLQIVELSQINTADPHQLNIVREATHFNPVDIVCGIKNYKGEKFDLSLFTDPDTGFISKKSFQGKNIKAMELPGLWNGAMAHWNTIFVEVPLQTFNPVKTVNDLLKETHQVI